MVTVHVLLEYNFVDEAFLVMQNIKNIDHVYRLCNLSNCWAIQYWELRVYYDGVKGDLVM